MRTKVFLAILIAASVAFAGIPDQVPLEISNVTQLYPTGDVSTATSAPLDGYVESIAIEAMSASMTCNVQLLVVTNFNYEVPLTLYYVTNFSASVWLPVRFPIADTNAVTFHAMTNAMERLMLYQQKLILRAWGAYQTNKNIRAKIRMYR